MKKRYLKAVIRDTERQLHDAKARAAAAVRSTSVRSDRDHAEWMVHKGINQAIKEHGEDPRMHPDRYFVRLSPAVYEMINGTGTAAATAPVKRICNLPVTIAKACTDYLVATVLRQ